EGGRAALRLGKAAELRVKIGLSHGDVGLGDRLAVERGDHAVLLGERWQPGGQHGNGAGQGGRNKEAADKVVHREISSREIRAVPRQIGAPALETTAVWRIFAVPARLAQS